MSEDSFEDFEEDLAFNLQRIAQRLETAYSGNSGGGGGGGGSSAAARRALEVVVSRASPRVARLVGDRARFVERLRDVMLLEEQQQQQDQEEEGEEEGRGGDGGAHNGRRTLDVKMSSEPQPEQQLARSPAGSTTTMTTKRHEAPAKLRHPPSLAAAGGTGAGAAVLGLDAVADLHELWNRERVAAKRRKRLASPPPVR
jgi:hypothetical protein